MKLTSILRNILLFLALTFGLLLVGKGIYNFTLWITGAEGFTIMFTITGVLFYFMLVLHIYSETESN